MAPTCPFVAQRLSSRSNYLRLFTYSDLHLLAGAESRGEVRIETKGSNGTIFLRSDQLLWTSRKVSTASTGGDRVLGVVHKTESGPAAREETDRGARLPADVDSRPSVESSLSMDAEGLLMRGMSTLNLSADYSFSLVVAGKDPQSKTGEPAARAGGSVIGTQVSVNVTAGSVGVEVWSIYF